MLQFAVRTSRSFTAVALTCKGGDKDRFSAEFEDLKDGSPLWTFTLRKNGNYQWHLHGEAIRQLFPDRIGIWKVSLWREETRRTSRKTLGARREPTAHISQYVTYSSIVHNQVNTNNKLDPLMTLGPWFEPRPHCYVLKSQTQILVECWSLRNQRSVQQQRKPRFDILTSLRPRPRWENGHLRQPDHNKMHAIQ